MTLNKKIDQIIKLLEEMKIKEEGSNFDVNTADAGMAYRRGTEEEPIYFCFMLNNNPHFSTKDYACPQDMNWCIDQIKRWPEKDVGKTL